MKSNKNLGKLAGLIFLIALIPYVIAQMVILEGLLYVPDYLQELRTNRTKVGFGILLKFISITAVLVFAVLVFPILRKYGNKLAIGFLGLRFIEFGILIFGSIKLLSLISLSQKLVEEGNEKLLYGKFLADSIFTEWEWIGFIYMFVFVLQCFVFYYLLLKSHLVPKLISIAGLLASVSILAKIIFVVLGLNIGGPYMFIPIGLVELVLGIWLLIFGFKDSTNSVELNFKI